MAEQKNEVVATFSDYLTDKLVTVENALPKDFNRTRFVQNAMAVINEKPELQKINKAQLVQGLLKSAYLGLDLMNKECYLIPYGNSIQFQTDYKGEIKFTKKYSIRPIKDIYAKVVREGDEVIEEIKDGQPTFSYKAKPFNNGEIIGVFAICLFEDGGMQYETMTTEDVNNTRSTYSKASNSKAWKNSFDEMAKKTVLRRLCKHIETDFESVEARMAWEECSDADFTVKREKSDEVVDVFNNQDVVDVVAEDCVVVDNE